jgi:murein DD-endopeptidase MepM/ murein hydrolase activator NlpD
MPFVAWMLLAAATLFIFSAVKGYSPLQTLRAILKGEPIPNKVKYQISSSSGKSNTQNLAPGPISFSGNFLRPVQGPVTSPFGQRWGVLHAGIDIAAGIGTPIIAAGSGTVTRAGWNNGFGNYVSIDHGGGYSTAYGHLNSISVRSGQSVSSGQTIGTVGSTGDSTGPHLHFEVRVNGIPKDPLEYIGRTVSV